jgi:hypothetical protein
VITQFRGNAFPLVMQICQHFVDNKNQFHDLKSLIDFLKKIIDILPEDHDALQDIQAMLYDLRLDDLENDVSNDAGTSPS